MSSIPPSETASIVAYYDAGFEEERLAQGVAQLEAVRTRQLLTSALPPAPATVADVGGGAGAHAFWLAEAGYVVHLLDPASRLVAAAKRRSETAAHPLASSKVGDACALPYPDASVDALLLLGPLYHLTTGEGRASALAEARRVLRPSGVLFASAISRWAGALYGLSQNLYAQPGFEALVRRTLADGQNRNAERLTGGFTTAYYHRPEELDAEISGAGFVNGTLNGVEGPACLLPDFEDRWRDPTQRRAMTSLAESLGTEPAVLGVSAHMLIVAFKPAS